MGTQYYAVLAARFLMTSSAHNIKQCSIFLIPVIVESYMVPPAFTEVGQLVFQGVLQHLEHNTDHHTQPPITKYQSLQR